MKEIKTRFAPSPTGFLHIGGARTALYSYLYAKAQGGKFVLRIEDTDKERSETRFADDIIASLAWLGLNWDEGPFYQSQRLNIYQEHKNQLITKGLAYEKEGAVFIKVPENKDIRVNDMLRGPISFNTKELTDFVIIKSEGFPAFHFAVVVDDATMGITHIIRGEDHISNTPKQLLIYEALGYPIPAYAHLPLIVGADHTPLSKRHGDTALSEYINQGYLAPALLNFLARMGWGHKNQEIFSIEELNELFDVKKVSKSPAIFDLTKLNWINAQHIKKTSPSEIFQLIKDQINFPEEQITPLIELMQPKLNSIKEIFEAAKYTYTDNFVYIPEIIEILNQEAIIQLIDEITEKLALLRVWNKVDIEQAIRALAEAKEIKAAQLIHPLRGALTGQKVTPGLFELMEIIGKTSCLNRLRTKIWQK